MKALIQTMVFAILFTALVSGFAGPAVADSGSAEVNLDFSLPVPGEARDIAYLGIPSSGSFSLDQVDADILIVEIFSMYCPICQREAPRVNALFKRLGQIKDKKVKLLGIGAGNSAYEVEFFRETYAIPFPVFSDGDFTIHKKIGERGTPFFIALTSASSGGHRIFFTHSGDMGDLDLFFHQLTTVPE